MYNVVATGVPASYSACVKLTIFITESEPLGSPDVDDFTPASIHSTPPPAPSEERI